MCAMFTLKCRMRFIHFSGILLNIKSLNEPSGQDTLGRNIDFRENSIILYIIQICLIKYNFVRMIIKVLPLLLRRDI
jgi:hypothetical protein